MVMVKFDDNGAESVVGIVQYHPGHGTHGTNKKTHNEENQSHGLVKNNYSFGHSKLTTINQHAGCTRKVRLVAATYSALIFKIITPYQTAPQHFRPMIKF